MIQTFNILDNIGQFAAVRSGARISLTPLTLIYAENARGKTTLAAILRSLATGDGTLITERNNSALAANRMSSYKEMRQLPSFKMEAGSAPFRI